MGDHFVMLVDRLLTESTLEAAIESINSSLKETENVAIDDTVIDFSSYEDSLAGTSPRKLEECRICQDEDLDLHMETPCSCRGSLKYAHRKCIQRWCNEKGDTICEICHQQYEPGYTAPPPIFRLGGLPMNLRGNWQISRRDLNNRRIITMVSTDESLLLDEDDDEDNDEYIVSTTRGILCCRSLAIIFMVLLILRHTLPIIASRNYSYPLIMLMMLRIAGILLPICIILRAVTSIVHRRNQQADEVAIRNLALSHPPLHANLYSQSLDVEAGRLIQHQQHVIAV